MTDGHPAESKPLRILIGADTFSPDVNGSATFTRSLAAGLAKRGHEVHLFVPAFDRTHGDRMEEHAGADLHMHRLYSWRWPPHPWLRFAMPWRIRANAKRVMDGMDPDVVHFQSHIVVGRGLAPEAKERGIRLVGTNHTMPENILQHVQIFPPFMLEWLRKTQWKSAAKWFGMADSVTAPTQRAADFFEANTGMRGVRAISCGIRMADYTPDFTPRTANRIVFLGRLDEEKHIEDLIRAVALLDSALDVTVEIVGDGDQKGRLEALVRELKLTDRISLLGKVSYPELKAALTRATVFAMPSRAELQSIATMEAMASALPVVAADAMALPHLVHDGENGYLFQPGDIEAFAAHLTTVLTADQAELDRMKNASLEIVKAHDIERTLDIFESIYRGEQN